MAKEVVFVADDFGLNPGINEAILLAHTSGVLTGAALMMGQPGTDEAVALAQTHPTLEIGWHLHLNDSTPVTVPRWPWGRSPARAGWTLAVSARARELVRREIAAQWALFLATGLPCRFVNVHHHLHAHPYVYRVLREVVSGAPVGWMRLGRARAFPRGGNLPLWSFMERTHLARRRRLSPWRTSDTLWGLDRTGYMQAAEVRAVLARLPDGLHEFLFHPRTSSCPDTTCLLELKSAAA